ncbi:MAG: hypothetical protein ACLPVW_09085 [Terriglobales bacterium]|jgi:hypothetical protein
MNIEALNGYVLGVIGFFAVCLYVAMIAAGFTELISRLPKAGTRKKGSSKGSTIRRWRNVKRSPNS